jgi:hypothetical protein
MIADDYRDPIKAVIVVLPQDCQHGTCDCKDASECKFSRCENCDAIIDTDGMAIDFGQRPNEWNMCSDCGGPL